MKITKIDRDGNTLYLVEGLQSACSPDHGIRSDFESMEISTDELARLSRLGAEILMADPAVAFVAG